MNERKECRSELREPTNVVVRLMWRSKSGEDQFAVVKALDFSESGLRVQLPVTIEARSFVNFQCESLGLQGSASVRYCTRQRLGYMVGLEFTGGTLRTPPTKDGT